MAEKSIPLILNEWKQDPWMMYAFRELRETYNEDVYPKSKSLLKFGASDTIGTSYELVWSQGGNETDPSTNAIAYVSSSSGSDTIGLTIEGHTVDGNGDFTFVVQTKTLAGQTKTALDTPLARCSRAYVTGNTANVGDVYIYEDDTVSSGVPQTASKIHGKIDAGLNQTFKAKTTFSSTDYFICTGGYGSIEEKTASVVDFRFDVRQKGSVYRPVLTISTNGTPILYSFKPYAIIPANADVRVMARASGANTSVDCGFSGIICAVR